VVGWRIVCTWIAIVGSRKSGLRKNNSKICSSGKISLRIHHKFKLSCRSPLAICVVFTYYWVLLIHRVKLVGILDLLRPSHM